jgi:hypothetical protein
LIYEEHSQSVDERCLGLEAVHSALRDLVQKVVKWHAEEKDLKNLDEG